MSGSYTESFAEVDLSQFELDRKAASILSEVISTRIQGICLGRVSENQITVAVADPSIIEIYNMVEVSTGGQYKPTLVKADPLLVTLALEWCFQLSPSRSEESWLEWLPSKRLESEKLSSSLPGAKEDQELTGEGVQRSERILKEAIALGVSDIHLESYQHKLKVRYRQDGVLRTVDEMELSHPGAAVIKRLKVLANMDVTQSRIPQGGRIAVEVAEESYDFRVSLVPVKYGESLVLRLLHSGALEAELEDLGFNEAQLKKFSTMIHRPHGMVLVTGPTGSGKTTTLYASLKEIARPDRKLLTVEDPIEYEVPDVVQVQVNTSATDQEKRVTFARILREFMRQDPDVILVGEIRDGETAEISIKAALTGHLVLSTLHTNDAVGIISRLKDQGVKPFLLASTLVGGIAQRLVRRVCQACQEPYELSEEEAEIYRRAGVPSEGGKFRLGAGCNLCRRTGYAGRVALFEILHISGRIKHLIEAEATQEELARTAIEEGMHTLLQDGLKKASLGLVSVAEVLRVCSTDQLFEGQI